SPPPSAGDHVQGSDAVPVLQVRGKRNVRLHDPSRIVKCQGRYWCFSTGMGVSSWHSADLDHWEPGPRVFREMPAWVREVVPTPRGHFWAPDVIHHDGRYLLYYSVSQFGKNTSAIGLASTSTLDPEAPNQVWTDEEIVIRSTAADDFNAIDPAVVRTPEGELWMAFGSFWSGIKLIQLDPRTGKRLPDDGPPRTIAWRDAIEAPHLYRHGGHYYLFVNWGFCCRGVESTYEIRVGRSLDIRGPYRDREGVELRTGGGTLFLGSEGAFIGPGHANVFEERGEWWFHCHFYDGTDRGRSWLALQRLTWDAEDWPAMSAGASSAVPSPGERPVPPEPLPGQ
ncbi:partial Intracellular endo-alpha-(1-_5)-L-arabinanase, partial [Anaerolineae bacterium]